MISRPGFWRARLRTSEQQSRPSIGLAIVGAVRLRWFGRGLAVLLLLPLLISPQTSCDTFDPFRATFDEVSTATPYRAAVQVPAGAPPQLKVMTWNVKFGGGRVDFFFDCHGERSQLSKEEVLEHLEGVAAKIRAYDPDILMLQEVDVASKRTAYVDQLQWLLDNTDLNHGAYASQWRADFIPQDGIGKVDSGNAILSRWPLRDATRFALAEITEFWFVQNYFWLRRNVLSARVAMPGVDNLYCVNVHAAAFSKDGTKRKHIDRFKQIIDDLAAAGNQVVAAGDLNALPPGSAKVEGFPDSVCPKEGDFDADSYAGEEAWMQPLYDTYASAIALDDYTADNTRFFSHTTQGDGFWNRKLDYFFTNMPLVAGSGLTHQDVSSGGFETMPLSDHAPLSAIVVAP